MRKRRKQAETDAPQLEPKRVSPVDIQQKEFRLALRGYNERDVDQFLDEVTEEVARLYADNKRLREEVEFSKTSRLDTGGAAEAESVIRQAKEEAARIIAEATARASTIGPAGTAGRLSEGQDPASGAPPNEIMGIFLARERAFLQNMANLIQAHAEGVKQDVRRVRERVGRQVPATDSPVARAAPVESRPTNEASIAAGEQTEGTEPEPEEDAHAPASADEPTRAWEPATDAKRPETEESRGDIVDLTAEGERAPEAVAEGGAGNSGQASEAEAAPSRMYGRAPAPSDARYASPQPTESTTGASTGPRVEDDDAREDRSIRELFWGED